MTLNEGTASPVNKDRCCNRHHRFRSDHYTETDESQTCGIGGGLHVRRAKLSTTRGQASASRPYGVRKHSHS